MSVPEMIHAQWRADARLLALVPPARLFTALAAGEPALPYVVVRHESGGGMRWTSHRRIDESVWEFVVWAASYESGAAVLAAVAARFDRLAVALAGGHMDMTRRESWIEPAENGRWRARARYRIRQQQALAS